MEGAAMLILGWEGSVLILLLMEYGHGDAEESIEGVPIDGLNPSFNGIWSWRPH